jgi:hypothetical protein
MIKTEDLSLYSPDVVSPPSLSTDIIRDHVIPFLGAKELLNVTCSCKVLYKSLSTELVVKSVMMGGERMFKKMKQIRDMSENGAIWPMEPIRMLRLVLAVMCEICGVRRVKQPRQGMAISICWHCCTKRRYTRRLYKHGEAFHQDPMLWNLALSNPRIFNGKRYGWRPVSDDDSRQKLWLENQGIRGMVRSTTNRGDVGVVFSYQTNDYFTYFLAKQHFDMNGEKIGVIANLPLINYILEKVQYLEVAHPSDVNDVVNECLTKVNAPPLNHAFYLTTVSTFDVNKERAIQRIGEIRDKRRMASDRYVQSKTGAVIRLISQIKEEIDDPNLSHFLSYKVNSDFASNVILRRRRKLLPINMSILFMQRFLRDILKHPSRIRTKKNLRKAASQIVKRCREEHPEEEMRQLRRVKQKRGYFDRGEYIESYLGVMEDSDSLIIEPYYTEWLGGGSVLDV